ncbi:related to Hsp90 co-chaperone AHA1 [Saccharomycodes ludwigii]|uniref:Related to Hsp90 co-chaperone AHA1 n=1 Tax=Saccharomycodes ludwigii TaxID=36035 RepID=A0A376B9H2_9ASCO|nr:hypothetical protein SCDLUD_001895 [Saccharomycodes ludwigii]KAH3902082.1 hypothetical protein SCDLUD_001895 [Saccharomycodes ludwigii]SSD61184.1 related to Hsp90 co-chaperone AHA1 [Saccharomycodes ludwigii]
MVVHNPNNWHWVGKNCIYWANEYMTQKLVGIKAEDAHSKVEITKVLSIEGDCEVNQRKGKVISLFDLKISLEFCGKLLNDDNETYQGSITVPEVAFDSDFDDYQFEISIYKETPKLSDFVKPLIRSKIIPQLREVFSNFGGDLLIQQGGDIQVPEEQVESQFTKQNQVESFNSVSTTNKGGSGGGIVITENKILKNSASGAKDGGNNANVPKYNSTTVYLEPTFNAPAEELYKTFTIKDRIGAWTKSELVCVENQSSPVIKKGDSFTLFGGNIACELVNSQENEKLTFKWRLKDWKPDYYSLMNLEFHESPEYSETKIKVNWEKVPIGEEDTCRSNFEELYVKSIKLTFGFGSVL